VLLWAARRDVAVEITLSQQQVNLEAYAGPCALGLSRIGESRFWHRAER
jgi:hypothetical protein